MNYTDRLEQRLAREGEGSRRDLALEESNCIRGTEKYKTFYIISLFSTICWIFMLMNEHLMKPEQVCNIVFLQHKQIRGFRQNQPKILILTIKVDHIFNQMQNQLKGIVKVLYNPYDQTKKQEIYFTILSFVNLHVKMKVCISVDVNTSLHRNLIL